MDIVGDLLGRGEVTSDFKRRNRSLLIGLDEAHIVFRYISRACEEE